MILSQICKHRYVKWTAIIYLAKHGTNSITAGIQLLAAASWCCSSGAKAWCEQMFEVLPTSVKGSIKAVGNWACVSKNSIKWVVLFYHSYQ